MPKLAVAKDRRHSVERLHRRYWAFQNKSKPSAKIVTALARELADFVWAIGAETERTLKLGKAA